MDEHSILTYSGAHIVGNLFVVVRVSENRLYPTFVYIYYFSRVQIAHSHKYTPSAHVTRARRFPNDVHASIGLALFLFHSGGVHQDLVSNHPHHLAPGEQLHHLALR